MTQITNSNTVFNNNPPETLTKQQLLDQTDSSPITWATQQILSISSKTQTTQFGRMIRMLHALLYKTTARNLTLEELNKILKTCENANEMENKK